MQGERNAKSGRKLIANKDISRSHGMLEGFRIAEIAEDTNPSLTSERRKVSKSSALS